MNRKLVSITACLAVNCATRSPTLPAADVHESARSAAAQRAATPVHASESCDLDRYIERAEQLRKLPVMGPISCRLEPQSELAHLAVQVALRDTPKAWLEGQVQFLRLMGFASDQFNMEKGLQSLTEEQLAGFYDPAGDILYVSKDLDPENSEMALVHEVVHALQDQHFDLGRRMTEAKTSDELSALQMLAEGDATSAMIDMPRGNGQIPPVLIERLGELNAFVAQASVSEVEVPALLRRSILAPYGDGLLLIERLRASGDWQGVDALWRASPHTTAQLLHPGRGSHAGAEVVLPAAATVASTLRQLRRCDGRADLTLSSRRVGIVGHCRSCG